MSGLAVDVEVDRFAHDRQLLEVACQVTPMGAQTASKAPGRVGPIGAFPLFARFGKGPYLYSGDDETPYVDWFNGNCAVTLGHSNPRINDRMKESIDRGTLLSLPTSIESRVAAELIDAIPCAEMVRFTKTGSEACAGAVRIARMATGRQVIAVVRGQYHGWHDWHCVTKVEHPGVPDWMANGIRQFTYNDLDSLREIMGADVAAVMLEPTLAVAPALGFLEGVKQIAHARGALLIFDEMITGGRWHRGGAQAVYGVTPDLATFGKAYANGAPLAFIAGRRDLMQHAWTVSGTFGGETIGLSACLAVLDILRSTHSIDRMHTVGRMLKASVNGTCEALRFPARLVGPDVRPVWDWSAVSLAERPLIQSLLQQELAAAHVLVHLSGWNTSAAHDAVAMEKTVLGCEQALVHMSCYLNDPPEERSKHLRGQMIHEGMVRPS